MEGRNHQWSSPIFCDEPEKLEGQDQGPAPYDLLTGSLAACTLITLRMYAKHKGYDFGEFSVEIDFHTNREHEEHIERRIVLKTCQTKSFNKNLSGMR